MGLNAEKLRYLPRPLARATTRLLQRSIQRPWIPVGVQRAWIGICARALRGPPGIAATPETLGGVPALRAEGPAANPDRAVLYLHGGGYIVGSARTYGPFVAWIAEAAGAPVHLVDYRLAPEHPYPAPVEDSLAAYRDLVASGIEPGKIAIAGDSAGAGLAIAIALRLREAGEEMPAGLALINGWLDLSCSGASGAKNQKRDVGLRRSWLVDAAQRYSDGSDLRNPEISPVEADLHGFPEMHVQVGTWDLLLSDSDTFVERARAAGAKVTYRRFVGMWHDFQLAAGQSYEADEAVRDIGAAIRRFWGEPELARARRSAPRVATTPRARSTASSATSSVKGILSGAARWRPSRPARPSAERRRRLWF